MDEYLTTREAAQLVHLSANHLAQLRFRGVGPRYMKPSARKVLYRRADLLAWLDSKTVTPSREAQTA